jgi:hypothetical protein
MHNLLEQAGKEVETHWYRFATSVLHSGLASFIILHLCSQPVFSTAFCQGRVDVPFFNPLVACGEKKLFLGKILLWKKLFLAQPFNSFAPAPGSNRAMAFFFWVQIFLNIFLMEFFIAKRRISAFSQEL